MNSVALSLADLQAFDSQPHVHGREQRFLCPHCGNDKPRDTAHRSMGVNVETGLYQCHRCKQSGKLSDFWTDRPRPMFYTRRDSWKAAFEVQSPKPKPSAPATADTWREHLESAGPAEGSPAEKYLEGRGMAAHLLGDALGSCRHHPSLMGRPAVVFPFRDRAGKTTALSARYIDGRPNGHRALGPKKQGVFTTRADVWEAPVVVLTEAPIDALSLAACGVPAVALGGVVGPEWLPTACGLKIVALAFDDDAPGDAAADKLAPLLSSYGANVVRLRPQRGKDWNAMLQEIGAPVMTSWLRSQFNHVTTFAAREKSVSDWKPYGWFVTPLAPVPEPMEQVLEAGRVAACERMAAHRHAWETGTLAINLYDPDLARVHAMADETLMSSQRAALLHYADKDDR